MKTCKCYMPTTTPDKWNYCLVCDNEIDWTEDVELANKLNN